MKYTTIILAALIGTAVSGYGVDLVDTNIVGAVNETASEAYTISDATGNTYNITNSSITAESGRSYDNVTANQRALGTGGIESTGATAREINIVGSTVAGSSGGSVINNQTSSGLKTHIVDAGNGMYVENVDVTLVDSTLSGGDGGRLDVSLASQNSSANGGFGIQLEGTSSLSATNATISGGSGGYANNINRAAQADGAAGILIDGGTVELNLSNTKVTGGDGGNVPINLQNLGSAEAGDGLLITGGATVTINGGTYEGGVGGTLDGIQQDDGSALEIQGSTVTFAGGDFIGGVLLSGTSSTLSFKDTYTSDSPFVQNSASRTQQIIINEWYDGQLQDVTLQQGAMRFSGTNAFNLDGMFSIEGAAANTALARFDSGLVVKSGGVLDLGLATSTASDATTESGSTVMATRNGTTLGRINATGNVLLESGSKWVINDIGTSRFTVGEQFTLASGASVSNELNYTDVLYVGENGSAGWLGLITNVYSSANAIIAVYGQQDINEVLGVAGDDSEFGRAMDDLAALVPQGSAAYDAIANVTPSLAEGRVLMTNAYYRVPEVTRALVNVQSVFNDQVRNRTRLHMNKMEVGYPAASTPEGAGGWNWLRGFSDRMEESVDLGGVRNFSDRAEDGTVNSANSLYDSMIGDHLPGNVATEEIGLPAQWQMWGSGYGSTAKQDDRDGFAGFESRIGGAILGIDKRMNNVLVGVGGGYTKSDIEGYEDNDAKVDTGHAVIYLAAHGERAFFDINVDGAFNGVDTDLQVLGYSASYNAFAAGLYLGGGYALPITGSLVLTPEASLLTTYYSHEAYAEKSSLGLPTKEYDSYDQVFPQSTVGATLTLIQKVDLSRTELAVRPELRGHWIHDFNAEMDDESYTMVGGVNTISTPLMATEEDLYKIGAGLRMAKWDAESTDFGVDIDYTFGEDFDAYIISGNLTHRF